MNSILSYMGGKSLLANRIIPRIPKHTCYCEVFAGAAWLMFKKEESKVEVINDINTDLITLYRVIKNHLDEFIRYLRWLLVSRDEFSRFRAETPASLTDIQRAVRFYYLLRCGYGGKVTGQTFNSTPTRRPRLNLLRIEEDLSAAHLRLSGVTIENLPYAEILRRYDRPETFFYLDPPYFGFEDYYGKDLFGQEDFTHLRDILSGIKGKFIMSINDTREIRDLFQGFRIETVETTYLAAGGAKQKRVKELLISGKSGKISKED